MSQKLPVVIAGAGPTGLMCALALAREGVKVVVCEAEPTLTHDLRAGSFHPPTQEMMAPYGITDQMHAHGLQVRPTSRRSRRPDSAICGIPRSTRPGRMRSSAGHPPSTWAPGSRRRSPTSGATDTLRLWSGQVLLHQRFPFVDPVRADLVLALVGDVPFVTGTCRDECDDHRAPQLRSQ